MLTLVPLVNYLLPFLGIILLLLGIKYKKVSYLIAALWFSLIALVSHYQTAGGEILGTYFDYKKSTIYTINLLILLVTLLYLFFKFPGIQGRFTLLVAKLFSIFLIIAEILLLVNLWLNAYFVENKRPNTRILQVASYTPLPYCKYRYLFYKINPDNQIIYLCPNYYLIIPSMGVVDKPPNLIIDYLKKI